ncbi:MAG: hypothetical protein GX561_03580 [Lentisphaerae bacterium]|jgi:tetratricopeptide (TPR) repeat protein|nr:hypothetical protein [Lentisphaerota bacterium]
MNYKYFLILLVLAILNINAQEITHTERERLLKEADTAFNEGLELIEEGNTPEAHNQWDKAIVRYERLASDKSYQNYKLFYNLANAYFLKDDLGHAILNYKKAEKLMPFDAKLNDNLAYAKSRRVDNIEEQEQKRVLKTLFFMHYDIPLFWREIIFLASFSCFWIALLVLRFKSMDWLKWCCGIAGLLTLAMAVSVTISIKSAKQLNGIVIVEEADAYKGGNKAYEKSFDEPLHAGTELVIIGENEHWYEFKLNNGATGWLPKQTVGTY